MAIRVFAIMAFFAYAVLWPINRNYMPPDPLPDDDVEISFRFDGDNKAFLWSWLIFTYFFTFLIIYVMNKETFRVIRIRQEYLGTQSTITDRTFRISGLPSYLKSEEKLKDLIEKLEIGQVENVSLCRNWKELDNLIEQRANMLHKLEETWSVHLGRQVTLPKPGDRTRSLLSTQNSRQERYTDEEPAENGNGDGDDDDIERAGENGHLLSPDDPRDEYIERERPTVTLHYGFLRLRARKTDAIDHYDEQLRRLDEKIYAARRSEAAATGTAFVTMDSIAACQMAIQAHIDPRPGQLLTKPAPAPSDVIWPNTYAPRGVRRLRSWSVTIFVSFLSVVWLTLAVPVAALLTICNLRSWFPSIVDSLEDSSILRALVETGLPTLLVSLLNVAVPFLYEYLSYQQGMISRGDVELSIISKNFFFSFFNIFIVFAVSSTAINVIGLLHTIQGALRNATEFARVVASQINRMSYFYTSFIMLQGLGLFPFRLLEVGAVFLYPIYLMGAKTPRDIAQIMVPPTFSYGFYLPTALLVFILCLVYSVLRFGFLVLTVGLVYFILGYFTYKYQLLYAMDQPQHATGGAWRIICNRIVLGLFVFQVVMVSELALYSGFIQSALTVPLIFLTIWYSHYFGRRFVPLTRFIALRSIRPNAGTPNNGYSDEEAVASDEDEEEGAGLRPSRGLLRRGSTIDEDREKGMRFLNPSLTVRLEQPWIYKDPPPRSDTESDGQSQLANISATALPEQGFQSGSSGSALSLGDTHVWRESGDNRV